MTSNAYDYSKAPVKGEGMLVEEPEEMSLEDQLVEQMAQVKALRRYRYIYSRLAQIAREGNLMINHPDKGFVLVEDLMAYMGEPK